MGNQFRKRHLYPKALIKQGLDFFYNSDNNAYFAIFNVKTNKLEQYLIKEYGINRILELPDFLYLKGYVNLTEQQEQEGTKIETDFFQKIYDPLKNKYIEHSNKNSKPKYFLKDFDYCILQNENKRTYIDNFFLSFFISLFFKKNWNEEYDEVLFNIEFVIDTGSIQKNME